MSVTRRIFVSMPADAWLTPAQNELKWSVVERIERLNYAPEIFLDPRGRPSLSAGRSWSADAAEEVARHCHGAAIIGLPRWSLDAADGRVYLPTEYCHYEGALARTLDLPLLILAQENLMRRVVFDATFGSYIGVFPDGAGKSWLRTAAFKTAFGYWRDQLDRRRDVFLGYCGASSAAARNLRDFLEQQAGATVLDWQRDFKPGSTILEQIEEARVRCTAGIFLFTKDDTIRGSRTPDQAAPRDNVVFEAGYFASAKGKPRVLIIRERAQSCPPTSAATSTRRWRTGTTSRPSRRRYGAFSRASDMGRTASAIPSDPVGLPCSTSRRRTPTSWAC
jgi:hypothetical protein